MASETCAPAAAPRPRRGWILCLLGVLWAVGVAVGVGWNWRYAAGPTAPGAPAAFWPEHSRIARAPGAPAILMFAHPECPCSRASLAELERVLARAPAGASATVVFMGSSASGLVERARAIEGLAIHHDHDGSETARFGAASSGHVLGYDAEGRLQFTGGVTPSRGHEGATEARAVLLALLRNEPGEGAELPVYGCGLRRPEDAS